MKAGKNNRKGFTLAEGLMAMVILAFAAGGVLLPFSSGAAVRVEAARITLASKLASDLIEEFVNDGFAALSVGSETESDGNMQDFKGDKNFTGDIYSGFSRTVTVKDADIGSIKIYWVKVEVFHNGRKMVTLSRLIGDS